MSTVNWKAFIDELIKEIQGGKTSWGKNELVAFIKDRQIAWMERYLNE